MNRLVSISLIGLFLILSITPAFAQESYGRPISIIENADTIQAFDDEYDGGVVVVDLETIVEQRLIMIAWHLFWVVG